MQTNEIDTTVESSVERIFKLRQSNAIKLKSSTAEERIARLKKIQDYILSHLDEAKEATFKDFKKPAVETIIGEIFGLNGEFNYTIKNLKKWAKPQRVSTPLSVIGTSNAIHYEAKGNALIISPWNYPISLAMKPLVSAIAAGCTVILKPSELTPYSSAFVRQVIENTCSPSEVAVIEGDVAVATALLALPFNHIFFTGSPAVGKIVMRAAADHLASVTLELGGKSPCIVDETADLPATARKIAWGKFLNNGQTCIAPDYLFVQRSVKADFIKEFTNAVTEMYNSEGKGVEASESYCRIVNEKHYNRLVGYLNDAVEGGAKVEIGGGTNAADNFIEPTLLTNVDDSMLVMKEEIFGPILPMMEYDRLEEVIDYINEKDKPLALYMNSRKKQNIDLVLKKTSAGDALINEFLLQFGNHELPFGGVNNSGIGKSNGFFGFQEFSNMKGVMKRRFGNMNFLFPPYTDKIDKLVSWAVKYV